MTIEMPGPDLWFRSGIPHGEYEDSAEVDEMYEPVRTSLLAGGVPIAQRVATFLAWVTVRDDFYRPALSHTRTAFVQDGVEDDPDIEVELNMTDEGSGDPSFDAALAELMGEPAPEVRTRADLFALRKKHHPTAGWRARYLPTVKWRDELSDRDARLIEWVPPALWVALTGVLFLAFGAAGFTNPAAGWMVDRLWPVPVALLVGGAVVRRWAVKVRDEVQPTRHSIWRMVFRREITRVVGVRRRMVWPVIAWGCLSGALFLVLPTWVAAVLSLAVLWSPVAWPKEQRARLVASLRRARPPLSLQELRDPSSVPEPTVEGLGHIESRPVGPGSPPRGPQLTRMSQPMANLDAMVAPLVDVAKFAECPLGQASAVQKAEAAVLLEMWCAVTGSALPYWGGRFGVWSADLLGEATALAVGATELPRVEVRTWAKSRPVGQWWEDESRGLEAIVAGKLPNGDAAAALAAAAERFIPSLTDHIPRALRLRAETMVFAARAAASRLATSGS